MAVSLIADIGGTNARFALVDEEGGVGAPMAVRCAEYAGPAEAARAVLSAHGITEQPVRGAFCVACPVTGDVVNLTNSAWHFSIEQVRNSLGLERLQVINDFTAVALSVRHVGPEHLLKVGGGAVVDGAPIAVLGPGTGLGVSALVPDSSGQWVALATEGGHVTLAATDAREDAVLERLRRRFGHVSAERVLAGAGLVNLYEALADVHGVSAVYTAPDAVSQRALDGSDPLCRETLELFFAMLGTVAGNLALTLGARGGVYLAGGILPRMRDAFAQSAFRRRFEDKGRFRDYLAPIPAWLVVHPQPAFAGLAGLVTNGK